MALKFRIACIILGLAISVAIIEISLALSGFSQPVFYQVDPDFGMSHRPRVSGWQTDEGVAYVEINQDGFRDRDATIEKNPGIVRIAVLGDSYTEALQVDREENFCSVAERTLNKLSEREFEVLNFGVAGYGTTQEWLLLKKRVTHYSPDIVVLAFFTGNDIRNNSKALEQSPRPFFVEDDQGGYLLDESFRETKYFAKRNSVLAQALVSAADYSRIVQVFNRVRRSIRVRATVQATSQFLDSNLVELGLDRQIYRAPDKPEWVKAWEVTEYALRAFADEVANQGAMLLVVTLSNGIQVDPRVEERRKVMKALGVDNLFYPDKRVERFCEENSMPVLVLAPSLRELAEKQSIPLHGFQNTQLFQGHWNENGHRFAGELIAQRILEQLRQ